VESLFAHAIAAEPYACRLPSGQEITLRRLRMRFGRASPEHLRPGALPPTYTTKPLVTFNGDAMFGELALVRWLEVDGWDAVWLDTFHGRKAWRAMPTKSRLGSPPTISSWCAPCDVTSRPPDGPCILSLRPPMGSRLASA
jgi:hypothetical protein